MKTPFDSALRVQRRAMDEIRVGLRAENDSFSSVVAARNRLETRLSEESAIAVSEMSVVSYAFADRLRAQRRGLRLEQERISVRLETMRDRVLAASGQLRAIEVAADDFGIGELRRTSGLEQAEADDLAGARLAQVGMLRSRRGTALRR